MNVVIVRGTLSRAPELRVLPSGDRLVAYEVTVREEGQRAESVPVVWLEAPARAAEMESGAEVVLVGRVRRRFFRTPAGTASRTEVVAESVMAARQRKRVAGAVASALATVTGHLDA